MERKLTIKDLLCGRWLLSTLTLLLMSVAMQAEDYDLVVAGVQVTSDNASNVLGDETPTVSFEASTNTLKLIGAKIGSSGDPAESCAITYVGSEDLTIEVYGTGNELIGTGGCDAIRYDGDETSSPRLIFVKGDSQPCELYMTGYEVVAGFGDVDFGGLNLLADKFPGLHWDDDYNRLESCEGSLASEVTLTSAEVYPIWVWQNDHNQGHKQVTAANKANIMGENDTTVSFDGNHTLTLNEAAFTELNEETAIYVGSSMTALTVNLVGASTIDGTELKGFYFVAPSILTFTTDESNPGSLTMIHGSIVSYEDNITLYYKNGLGRLISQQDVITTDWVRSLYIDGVPDEITGDYTSQDESVKYVAATHTLTLTNATINGGISSNIDHLTINLVGTNNIGYIGSGGDDDTSVEFTGNGTLTFSSSDGVMLGFNSVDFGDFNLLSNSTPGIHWDEMTKALKNYDNGAYAAELTLTKDVVYPIWVYDASSDYSYRQITAANKTNVLGDDLSEEGSVASVSFDAETNTLTLNGAQIDMSNSFGQCVVESSFDNLKVKLLGYNTVTIADNSDWPSYVFRYIGKSGNAQLTFETGASQNGSYGSISASGIQYLENLTRNYTITNQLIDSNGESEPEQTGWHHSEQAGSYKSVNIKYVEYYDLWMGGVHINSGSLMPVSGGTAYIPATHTLHLSGYGYSDVISSKMPELIVEVEGSNNLSGFSYTGNGNGRIVFCPVENSWSANTVSLNNDDDGVIVGFSEVVIEEPLRVVTPATTPTTWTSDIKSAIISDDLYLEVAGTKVTANNKNNVLGDGKVSFDAETNTLTLNGATINGGILCSLNGTLTVHLQGQNVIDGGYEDANNGVRAFVGELQTTRLKITTDAENPGQLLLKRPYINEYHNAEYYSEFMYPSFKNGLVEGENSTDKKVFIAYGPVVTPGQGLYWTDQQYTIPAGAQITCSNSAGIPVEVSVSENSFTLTEIGKYNIRISKAVTVDDSNFNLSSNNLYIVHTKPGFSKAAGSYAGPQTITLTNLPENLPEGAEDYPQVWYYLGENANDPVRVYSAEQEITVSESTKVCVYFIDEDSNKVLKSKPVEAEYVILQQPGYHFSDSESGQSYYSSGTTVYNLDFGQENTLPWLINVPEGLTITYASEDENVATIDQTGKITLTGAGHVWLTASNEETAEYAAHTERIRLEIRPTDPQASLEEGAYYVGKKVTLIPTVPNGTIYYSFGSNGEKTKYTEGDEIVLPKGEYEFYTYTRCVTEADDSETDYMQSYGNNHRYYYVYDQPTFSVEEGTYNDDVNVKIENLPTTNSAQVYYYFYDETLEPEDEESVLYHSDDVITMTKSKILKAYIVVEGDSGKQYKSIPVKAEYTVIPKTQLNISYAQSTRTWASYCATEKSLETPEGMQAYVVKEATKSGVVVEAIDYIPQGVGVLLKRTAETISEPIMAKAYMKTETETYTSELVGTTASQPVKMLNGTVYVLYNDGFTRATSGSIGANRGYLLFADVIVDARLSIFEDETTAIEHTNRETITNNKYYNLNGQRVAVPKKKGLYILNGQTVIVK